MIDDGSGSDFQCSLCGGGLSGVSAQQPACPTCEGQPRTRTLPEVFHKHVAPYTELEAHPVLLAFSMPTIEERVLAKSFSGIVSVSLYGKYRSNHIEGIDVRNLSRFDAHEFNCVFGSLLFDYFEESEIALGECYRVLKPGGIFFTHIAPNRILSGYEAPRIRGIMAKRANYFDYVPEGAQLPSIEVSADWFVSAMERVGFKAKHVIIVDDATGIEHHWFLGYKGRTLDLADRPQFAAAIRLEQTDIRPIRVDEVRPQIALISRARIDLPPSSGLREIEVELISMRFEEGLGSVGFSEHGYGRTGAELVCVANNAVLVSCDDGRSFQRFSYNNSPGREFLNTFSPRGYDHRLLQIRGWMAENDPREEDGEAGRLYIMQPDGVLSASGRCSSAQWHGSHSIDQAGSTIIFGDYNVNTARFRTKQMVGSDEARKFIRNSSLFRSTDAGLTWTPVLQISSEDVRHFHTVVADRVNRGVWWASTGDFPSECRIYRSIDDGMTWADVSAISPDVPHPPGDNSRLHACYRHTAMIQTESDLRWGADDIYGAVSLFDYSLPVSERAGARLYVASREIPISPREVGYSGHPVRSTVELDEGYLLFTEAYYRKADGSLLPEIKFWSKKDPNIVVDVMSISNMRDTPTGFTYSKSSRVAIGGSFFTYRGPDVGSAGSDRILKWSVRTD